MKQDRLTRVNRLLQETIAEKLSLVKDPRVMRPSVLSVVAVRTSADLRYAKVYLSVAGEEAVQREALAGLNHARGFLRGEVGRAIRLRYTPELHFFIDDTIENAARIEGLLREIANGRSIAPENGPSVEEGEPGAAAQPLEPPPDATPRSEPPDAPRPGPEHVEE